MPYDEGLAEQMRADLGDRQGLSERRMFGGLAFLLDGNMVCGVTRDGGMFRVGKASEAAALSLAGVEPLAFTGRRMGGIVQADDAAMADDEIRGALMRMAVEHAGSLPPK